MIEKPNINLTEIHLDEVIIGITKYKHHASIKVQKMEELKNPTFSYNFVCREEIVEEIDKLSSKKAFEKPDIPAKIIEENKDLISCFLHHNFNNSLPGPAFLLP